MHSVGEKDVQGDPVIPVQRPSLEPLIKSTSDVSKITESALMRPLAVQAIPKFPNSSSRRPRVTEDSTVSQNEGTKRFPTIASFSESF